MVKTKKYKSICNVGKRQCNPFFCKFTKRCVPKKEYTVDSIPIEYSTKTSSRPKECKNLDDCLLVGSHITNIHDYFHSITNFTNVHEKIHKIKTAAGNGFIYKIPYQQKKDIIYAMLKSARKKKSDNLLYEFLIGYTYINTLVNKFPCFIYTYGLYYYRHDRDWQYMYNQNEISSKHLPTMLSLQSKIKYDRSCVDSKYISILIQGLQHSERISDKLNSSTFLNHHLAHVLFIIHHTLASLTDSFTHYDLHVDNVLLVRPSSKKHIKYVYHVQNPPITFTCPYIPKIIDYGRCFFDNGTIQSKMIYDKLCSVPECKSCGKYDGFSLLSPRKFYTISSQIKNESHDLRLLNTINMEAEFPSESTRTLEKLKIILNKVVYGKGLRGSKKAYGTVEQSKLNYDGSVIENVTDAYYQLMYLITSSSTLQENKSDSVEIDGTLHVYNNKPMVYIKE